MTARCSTPEMICLQCGDRGWSNAFVYCVKCLNVSVHRYCLDVIPNTSDEFVQWICDDCSSAPSNLTSVTPSISTSTPSGSIPTPTSLASAGEAATQFTFIRPTLAKLKTQMTLYNKSDVLEEIVEELSKMKDNSTELVYGDALHLLKSSQFGYLYKFTAAYYVNRRAMHALLCRQVKVTDSALADRELHFYVSENLLVFGPAEYNLVTGLRMGRSRVDPTKPVTIPEHSLFTRLFQRNKIYVGEVRRRFLTGAYRHADSQDVVKVAQILTVYYMIFCFDNPKKRVDDWVWAIVDDEDEWNAFPWGAYAFQILMHFVSILPRVRSDHKGSSKDGSYHFFGPSWVLMVWMVEMIPELVGQLLKVIDGVERLPRCLKYQIHDTDIDFTKFFDKNVRVCFMIPTPEEVFAPYFYRAGGDPLGVGCTKPSSKATKKFPETANKPMTCARIDDVEPTRQTTHSNQPDASDETMHRGSKRRRARSRSHSDREILPSGGLFERLKEYIDAKFADAVKELKGYIDEKFKSAQHKPRRLVEPHRPDADCIQSST